MAEFADRDDRQAEARAAYERIMTSPSPDPTGAYIDSGVIGFVFGEMWRRGVLTARDRRLITLTCVAAAGATTPIDTHVWAALNCGDLTYAEYDELVLFLGTQLGWPKASVMTMYGMTALFRLCEERGLPVEQHAFEPWVDPVDDDERRRRGEDAYESVHGTAAPAATTAFGGRGRLDYLYGEVWTRTRYLTRRDRRVVSICASAANGIDEEVAEHLRAGLALGDLTAEELQELVLHYAVHLGWPSARRIDDLLVAATEG